MTEKKLEVWLQGPLSEVPDLLQPVAQALLQAKKEVKEIIRDFPENLLWERPVGLASVGFHLQHLTGVLDRLFTYAREEPLATSQIQYLAAEGNPDKVTINLKNLVQKFNEQVFKSIQQLIFTNLTQLTHVRYVGRNRVPSTMLGLLFHAAEHIMRHLGQLLVTVQFLKARPQT